VLAAAGVLAGRRATTHWRYAEALAARYPDIRIVPDVLYVDEGQVLTSAGSAAGLDLCLHIVRRDWGARIANQVARRLVVPPHREGGQAQYVDRPVQVEERPRLAALFDWARRHLAEDLPLERLAGEAGMSLRTFLRRFREATGTTGPLPRRLQPGLTRQRPCSVSSSPSPFPPRCGLACRCCRAACPGRAGPTRPIST
jgi:AraC family transcriptional activator FtrA